MRIFNDKTRRRAFRRRGAIFIMAMGIVVILSGMLLVFAEEMRAEAMASANRLSYDQADAVEKGAEQWVLAQVEEYGQDAVTLCNNVPAEGIQVGQGYFWIIRPNQDSNQNYDFGLVDESGKLNLNVATSDELQILPNMQQNLADAIVDWHNPEQTATGDGAKSPTYQSLPEPYDCKDAPFESVEELRLVYGMTPQILFGAGHQSQRRDRPRGRSRPEQQRHYAQLRQRRGHSAWHHQFRHHL